MRIGLLDWLILLTKEKGKGWSRSGSSGPFSREDGEGCGDHWLKFAAEFSGAMDKKNR
jgi:hypothetical protein